MTIIARASSGNKNANIPPSAEVYSTQTNTTITRRVGTLEMAIEASEQIARQMADQDSVVTGFTIIQYLIDDEIIKEIDHYAPLPSRAMIPGDIDITPIEVDLTEEEEAVVEAKELTTDLVAKVLAEESEDTIVAQHDDIDPAAELVLPTVVIAQDGDRVEITVHSVYPFTMWRSIGGRTGTKAISAGESTHSYKGTVEGAELRLDDENGPSLI